MAQSVFSALSDENLLAGAAKHKSYLPSKAQEHASYCHVRLALAEY